jgi:uridine kinase
MNKEQEKLIITVSGRAMSGKSRLSFLLKHKTIESYE